MKFDLFRKIIIFIINELGLRTGTQQFLSLLRLFC